MSHHKSNFKSVSGGTVYVPQKNTAQYLNVIEPTFTMKLPSDWKKTSEVDTTTTHSITWAGTSKDDNNRSLTIYIDTIPATMPVNQELPITVHGNQISYALISGNCSDFTPGGTEDVAQAVKLAPKASVWQGVNFICNLPRVVDNQIGTGSAAGVNTFVVTGPKSGTHKYFFLYNDRNIHSDESALYNAIESFRAT